MGSGADPLDEPWSFLWGKRRWRRQPLEVVAELHWKQGSLLGRTTNLSMGGAMLEVPRSQITEALARLGQGAPTDQIHTIFEPPLLVRFVPGPLCVSADMVRMAWRPDQPGLIYLACRFRAPLTPDDVRTLGLEPKSCSAESGYLATPSDKMPQQVNVGAKATLEVWTRDAKTGSPTTPYVSGPLLAMNRSALAFRVPDGDPMHIVSELSAHSFTVRVVARGEVAATDHAWLLAVRGVDGSNDVEVVVELENAPDAGLRALFHGRTRVRAS